MQTVSNGDRLHEKSNLVFQQNKKNVINLSSAELALRVGKVKVSKYLVQLLLTDFWIWNLTFNEEFVKTLDTRKFLTLINLAAILKEMPNCLVEKRSFT